MCGGGVGLPAVGEVVAEAAAARLVVVAEARLVGVSGTDVSLNSASLCRCDDP